MPTIARIKRPVEWRPVPGYKGLYSVTRDGRVWSHGGKFHPRGADHGPRWLAPYTNRQGYILVWLRDPVTLKAADGRAHGVHRLVLSAWGPPRPSPNHWPNHKDFNPANNHISNLEWLTNEENLEYSRAAGRMSQPPNNNWQTMTEATKATRAAAISKALRGRPKSAEHRVALSKARTGRPSPRKGKSNLAVKGSIWITNGTDSRMIRPNEPISPGWHRGRPWFTRHR